MPQTLTEVKKSIDRFLFEAQGCAESEYGFSAMLTAFSIIMAVSEAVIGPEKNKPLLIWFIGKMGGETTWLTLPQGSEFNPDSVGGELADLRDSLSHQFSMPGNILLVNNKDAAKTKSAENPDKIIISTKEFVSAVRNAVDKIVTHNPGAVLDARPRVEGRSAAIRIETGIESDTASGSSGGGVPVSAAFLPRKSR